MDEMGGSCRTHRSNEICIKDVGAPNPEWKRPL
jgi:hypothetical protein